MPDRRRYKRFILNDLEVNGKMISATEIRVVDISISGISLKLNKRLNIGCDYPLKLEGKSTVSLKGTVVWCSLVDARKISDGETMPIYAGGLQFKNISAAETTNLLKFIEDHKIEELRVTGGTRLNVRFHITDPKEAILNYSASYKVKMISLGGMLIECMQDLDVGSRLSMELLIHDDTSFTFLGRVASCRTACEEDRKSYDIGIEFLDLTDKDREILSSIIDSGSIPDSESGNTSETTAGKPADEDIPVISAEFIDINIDSLDLTENDVESLSSIVDNCTPEPPEKAETPEEESAD